MCQCQNQSLRSEKSQDENQAGVKKPIELLRENYPDDCSLYSAVSDLLEDFVRQLPQYADQTLSQLLYAVAQNTEESITTVVKDILQAQNHYINGRVAIISQEVDEVRIIGHLPERCTLSLKDE